jgi:hypothetical protein
MMKEQYLKLSWDELKTIRITCQSCQGVFETQLERLEPPSEAWKTCPICKASFLLSLGEGNYADVLKQLGSVLRGLKQIQKQFTLDILIPDE